MTTNTKPITFGILVFFALGASGCGDDSSSKLPPVKDLKAAVSTNLSAETISVTNTDAFPYKHFVVHLNETGVLDDGFMSSSSDLAVGQTQTYNLSDFAKPDGTRFQISQTKIVKINIDTKDDKGDLDGMGEYSGTN